MSLALIVYLVFTALPAINNLSIVAFGVWAILTFFGTFIGLMALTSYSEDATAWNWTKEVMLKRWAKYAIACLVIANLVPTKEVTAYMLGAYGVQTIAENEKVQELGAEGLDVLQSLMKKAKAEIEANAPKEEK